MSPRSQPDNTTLPEVEGQDSGYWEGLLAQVRAFDDDVGDIFNTAALISATDTPSPSLIAVASLTDRLEALAEQYVAMKQAQADSSAASNEDESQKLFVPEECPGEILSTLHDRALTLRTTEAALMAYVPRVRLLDPDAAERRDNTARRGAMNQISEDHHTLSYRREEQAFGSSKGAEGGSTMSVLRGTPEKEEEVVWL